MIVQGQQFWHKLNEQV